MHAPQATNRRSWKSLCSRKSVTKLPSWNHGGMTCTTEVDHGMYGCKPFRRDWEGRRGSGMSLVVREGFGRLELNKDDKRVHNLWLSIRLKANTADMLIGVFYRPPN